MIERESLLIKFNVVLGPTPDTFSTTNLKKSRSSLDKKPYISCLSSRYTTYVYNFTLLPIVGILELTVNGIFTKYPMPLTSTTE